MAAVIDSPRERQTNEMELERERTSVRIKAQAEQTPSMAAGPARPISELERALREFDSEGAEAVAVAPAPVKKDQVDEVLLQAEHHLLDILMKNAQILIDAREMRLALNILRNILMRQPEHADALQKMGECLRDEGRYEEALKCFRALAKTAKKVDAQVLIAETLYLSERDQMALASYREVLKSVIDDSSRLFEIYKNVGNIHVRAGDFESAEEFYNKAYILNPTSDALMVNYGTLEIQRDNLGEAVQRFRRAVEFNPENDRGWVGLALVHRQMGDQELAWANVQRALDINKRNRTAIRLVVEWGGVDHDFSIAITRLQEYLAIECEDAEMSFTLAKILTHTGRLWEARIEIERVLALDPAIEGAEAVKQILDRELSRA